MFQWNFVKFPGFVKRGTLPLAWWSVLWEVQTLAQLQSLLQYQQIYQASPWQQQQATE